MIGITGVTGKLGSYVADLIDQRGMASVHLARSPERATVYASAEIRDLSKKYIFSFYPVCKVES